MRKLYNPKNKAGRGKQTEDDTWRFLERSAGDGGEERERQGQENSNLSEQALEVRVTWVTTSPTGQPDWVPHHSLLTGESVKQEGF